VRVLAWRTGQLRMHVPAMDARGNPVLDLEARYFIEWLEGMPGIQSIWRLCDELEKQPAALLRRPFIPAPSWVQLIVASQRGAGECILGSVRPCPTAD